MADLPNVNVEQIEEFKSLANAKDKADKLKDKILESLELKE